jgi:hypothetical protein
VYAAHRYSYSTVRSDARSIPPLHGVGAAGGGVGPARLLFFPLLRIDGEWGWNVVPRFYSSNNTLHLHSPLSTSPSQPSSQQPANTPAMVVDTHVPLFTNVLFFRKSASLVGQRARAQVQHFSPRKRNRNGRRR